MEPRLATLCPVGGWAIGRHLSSRTGGCARGEMLPDGHLAECHIKCRGSTIRQSRFFLLFVTLAASSRANCWQARVPALEAAPMSLEATDRGRRSSHDQFADRLESSEGRPTSEPNREQMLVPCARRQTQNVR